MGGDFFGLSRQQADTGISDLKLELKKQEAWIAQLHGYSRDLHKYAAYINESNTKHKREIVTQINDIVRWVDHFNESHLALKREVAELKISLRRLLRQDFETYHKTLDEYMRLKFEEQKVIKEEMKELLRQDITKELREEILSLMQKKVPSAAPQEAQKPLQDIAYTGSDLSNPEKELLNLLFNEGKPMTYEDISSRLGKSISSIRVYMNSLRIKKPMVEEFTTPSGTKVFSIKNSEMVKTLFNIR